MFINIRARIRKKQQKFSLVINSDLLCYDGVEDKMTQYLTFAYRETIRVQNFEATPVYFCY